MFRCFDIFLVTYVDHLARTAFQQEILLSIVLTDAIVIIIARFLLTVHIGHKVLGHETSKDSHDHFVIDLYNVFWEGIDTGTDPACH
jgi:hypothetical protein